MIILRNLSNSRATRRMIERRIVRWLLAQGSSHNPPGMAPSAQYNALLSREGSGHDVSVELEVVREDGIWRGRFCAPGPDLAIRLALKSMKLVQDMKRSQSVVQMMRPIYATIGG